MFVPILAACLSQFLPIFEPILAKETPIFRESRTETETGTVPFSESCIDMQDKPF